MATSAVDYAAIRADYEFFLNHSTETEAQIAAFAPHLSPPPRSMLDFGCGTGAFTAALLAAYPAPKMILSLVEPVEAHRAGAEARLASLVGRIDHSGADLPNSQHELILANHSLYYVSDLTDALQSLLIRRAENGRLIIALLDRANALAELWQAGFELAAMPFPFALAEDAETALARLGAAFVRENVDYVIDFPDTAGNRASVLRFLFGTHVPSLPPEAADLFDKHRTADRIVIETLYPHLVVR